MGRHPLIKIPSNPIRYLWDRHKEIARRVVAGERPIDIAHAIGMTPVRLSIIMNSPIFKKHLDGLTARADINAIDIGKRLQTGAQTAMEHLENILNKKVETPVGLHTKVALEVLDRAGYGKVQKIHSINENITLTGNRIEEIKAKRKAMLKSIEHQVIEGQIEET